MFGIQNLARTFKTGTMWPSPLVRNYRSNPPHVILRNQIDHVFNVKDADKKVNDPFWEDVHETMSSIKHENETRRRAQRRSRRSKMLLITIPLLAGAAATYNYVDYSTVIGKSDHLR